MSGLSLPAGSGAPAVISVFLADDDARFRGIYRKLFERSGGFRVAGESGRGDEAARTVLALKPDVALLDVQMPGGGLAAARDILAGGITRVVMLTTFDLDEYVYEALSAGASGFMLKNAAPEEILHAVRTVAAGHAMLSPEITARLIRHFAPPGRPNALARTTLTARELDVTRLVAQGLSNQQIADELLVSLETVRTYLRRMFAKLGVRDRTQLAIMAHEAGLLRSPRP